MMASKKDVRNGTGKKHANGINHRTKYTVEEVVLHNRAEDAWVIVESRVYNITKFLDVHPGGAEIMLDYLGEDVTEILACADPHQHSRAAYELLSDYYIGVIEGASVDENDDLAVRHSFDFKGYHEEDLVDWNKAILPQVGKLGKQYEKWVHSPVDKKLRLFPYDIFEIFSYCPWYTVPLVWLPIASYVTHITLIDVYNRDYYNTLTNSQWSLVAGIILSGILLWTLLEYGLHRFLFHASPPADSPILITLHFLIHGQHHKVPFDPGRLVFPPVPASFLVTPLYLSLAIFGNIGRLIFVGGLLGYVGYDCIHYYLHHGSPAQGTYFKSLKTYHVAHHFVRQDKGFGISSKLWDIPFNTLPPRA